MGLNGGRRGGVGSQLQRSLSQGIRTSAPACALMGGLPLLTGARNTCGLLAQSPGNRNHMAHIEAWQVEKRDSRQRNITRKVLRLFKETHFGNG